MKKLHVAGILAALTTLVGAIGSPEVLSLLPPRAATALILIGSVLQAVTKGVQHGGTDLVPKGR